MNFDDLRDVELQEKLKAVKTPEELFELAKDCGIKLNEDQLMAVTGGCDFWCWECLKDGVATSV